MCEIRLIESPIELWALRPRWEALWSRCRGGSSQSYAASRAAWTEMTPGAAARPVAVTAFAGAALVGLWTGVVTRRSAWRVLRPMGSAAADVSDLLLDPDMPSSVAADMWRAVASDRHADVAAIPYVRAGGPLGEALSLDDRAVMTGSDVAPYVSWGEAETWSTYYASLSGHYRKLQRQKRKRLKAQGAAAVDITRDPEAVGRLVVWILEQKRIWSKRTGKNGPWLASDGYRRYLEALPRHQGCGQSFAVATLRSGDALAAAMLIMVSEGTLETMLLGFDPAFSQCSPGLLLGEACLEYAMRERLRVELGVGTESNKQVWSRGASARVDHFRVALSAWGRVGCDSRTILTGLKRLPLVRRRAPVEADVVPAD